MNLLISTHESLLLYNNFFLNPRKKKCRKWDVLDWTAFGCQGSLGSRAMGPLWKSRVHLTTLSRTRTAPLLGITVGVCPWGRDSCPTMRAPLQLWEPLSLGVQEILWECNPGFNWQLFQTLLWLVCALRVILLLHLTLRQINLLTAVATPFLNPVWIEHMSRHCTDQQ